MKKIAHVSPSGAAIVLVDDIPVVDDMPIVLKGHYSYRFITKSEEEMDVWQVVRRRYKRAIRIFRKRIDAKVVEGYPRVPYYRDEDVSELILAITNNSGNPDLPEILFDLIKNKENVRKENSKKSPCGRYS